MTSPKKVWLVFNQCPEHGISSISLDHDHDGDGTRLISGKYCGRWDVIHRFPMNAYDLKKAIICFENALEDITAIQKTN
jgi:hypothetical protein